MRKYLSNNKKLTELITLRFIAILLVVNSHLTLFYEYEYFATGGALGNSIFFFISGIVLSNSLSKKKIPFNLWYKKRFLRIYPKIFFVVSFFVIIGYFEIENINEFLLKIIFPVEFWFLPVLFFFYLPVYFVITRFSLKNIKLLLIIIFIIYCFAYFFFIDKNIYTIENVIPFKSIFYFFIMISSIILYKKYYKLNFNFIYILSIFVLSLFSYYFIKFLMLEFHFYKLQVLEHLFIIIILFSLFFFLKNEKFLKIQNNKYIFIICSFVSSLSLEIYLIHGYFTNFSIGIFPFNLIIFGIVVIIFAFILNKCFLMIKLK